MEHFKEMGRDVNGWLVATKAGLYGLGPGTTETATSMTGFDPGKTWTVVPK